MKRFALALFVLAAGCDAGTTPVRNEGGQLDVRLPLRANDPLRIEQRGHAGVSLEIRAVDAAPVLGRREGQRVVYESALEGTDVVHLLEADRTEELRYVSHAAASIALRYDVTPGPQIARLRAIHGIVEALDANGSARFRTEPAFAIDRRGEKRALVPAVDGWSITFTLDARGLAYPLTIDPAWTLTTSLAKARRDHSLHLLSSGNLIAISGLATDGETKTTEIYDPATATWTYGADVITGRYAFGASQLSSGKIVLVGGLFPNDSHAELFDPVAGTSVALPDAPGSLGDFPTATPLSATNVLVVGAAGAFLLDLSAKTWTATTPINKRHSHVAIPLPSGKVLVAGGYTADVAKTPISTAEMFDPTTKTWTAVASMKSARQKPAGHPLPGGKALVAGGYDLSTAEIFDPSTGAWTSTPPMNAVHTYAGSVVLPSNKVLVIAGDVVAGVGDVTEIYDPTKNTWTMSGRIASPRDDFPAAVMASGKVLIAGGSIGSAVATSEVFDPMTNGSVCIGAAECTSGFCTEGVCCEQASCAADQTCAGKGTPGKCLKTNGTACTADADCGSAHCVDGVCCDTACTDLCGACDVAGKKGICSPAPAGDAPHGTRGACAGEGDCKGRCGGVDKSACTQFPSASIICAAPKCESGIETRARGCDGAGTCAPPLTHSCGAYACGDKACKTECGADTDCASGSTCNLVTRTCVNAAKCDGDHTVVSAEGNAKDCTPYRCDGSRCLDTCTETAACAAGFVCDTATTRCVPGESSGGDQGGCSFRRQTPTSERSWLIALIVVAASRWRRRRAPASTRQVGLGLCGDGRPPVVLVRSRETREGRSPSARARVASARAIAVRCSRDEVASASADGEPPSSS